MARFDAAFGERPDAVPIPQAAHELLSSVLAGLKPRHPRRDWNVAAAILKKATDTMCNDVYFVRVDDQQTGWLLTGPGRGQVGTRLQRQGTELQEAQGGVVRVITLTKNVETRSER